MPFLFSKDDRSFGHRCTQLFVRTLFSATLVLSAQSALAQADFTLGEAPRITLEESALMQHAGIRDIAKALDPALTRAEVVTLYNTEYLPGNTPPSTAWTGSLDTCQPGTISAASRAAMITRVNVFRKLARLKTVALHDTVDVKDEQTLAAAFMYSKNANLSHAIPTSWLCYSTPYSAFDGSPVGENGNIAGQNSNIGLAGNNIFATPAIIDAYIDDGGTGNALVGHRRWLLYPPQGRMTPSSVPSSTGGGSANAIWVLDFTTLSNPSSAPDGVAWPPRGFVPYQLLPTQSNRWSFSFPGANFGSAVVTMTKAGQPVAIVGYDSRTDNGYGDNTIVWRPTNGAGANAVSYTNPGADTTYSVTISGINCTGAQTGCASTMTYSVTVIDPAAAAGNPVISGATQLNGGAVSAGVSFCSSPAGVSCTVTGSTYSCTVPTGYTGTLHALSATHHYEALQLTNVTANQTINFNTSRTESPTACILDIDRNGLYDPTVDGVAIMRRMAGFDVNAFTSITPGVCARNTTAQSLFDAAAPARFNATGAAGGPFLTTDGLIVERVLRGMRANSIVNAIPSGATRTLWSGAGQIQQWFINTCGYPAN